MALHEKKGNLHARKGQGKRNNNNINNNTFSSSSRRGDIQGTDPGGCEFFYCNHGPQYEMAST